MWTFELRRNTSALNRGEYLFGDVLSTANGYRAFEEISQWPGYAVTPLRDLTGAASLAGVQRVLYKDESSRFGLGSFKALGGAYAVVRVVQSLLSERLGRLVGIEEVTGGEFLELNANINVACASDGNHGRSVAAGAQRLGCNCTIFLHEGVSPGRERAILELGASVIRTPGNYDDSVRDAVTVSRANGWQVIADTTEDAGDPIPALVMQGYASLIIETIDELKHLDERLPTHVFLQGGVGGLAASVVSFLWESLGGLNAPTFVVVEPRRADCLFQSAVHQQPTPATGDLDTLMAGLSCGEVSRVAWPILLHGAEFFMTIEDEAAVHCMRMLHKGEFGGGSITAGESGVAGLAGLMAAVSDVTGHGLRRLRLNPDSVVLTIGTEGATDPEIYQRMIRD